MSTAPESNTVILLPKDNRLLVLSYCYVQLYCCCSFVQFVVHGLSRFYVSGWGLCMYDLRYQPGCSCM